MESQTSPSNAADDLNLPPGTFEYVDKKINWKKFFEILGLLVIIAVPLILSLYRINYSFTRNYQAVSPADVGTLPSEYQFWGSVITSTKKFFEPAATPTPASTPNQIYATSTPIPNIYPTSQSSQSTNQGSQQQTYPNQVVYPTDIVYPTNTPTPIPTSTPTPIPINTPVPSPTPNTTGVNPAIVACYGKFNGANCSYQSNGDKIEGRCGYSNGFFMCIPH